MEISPSEINVFEIGQRVKSRHWAALLVLIERLERESWKKRIENQRQGGNLSDLCAGQRWAGKLAGLSGSALGSPFGFHPTCHCLSDCTLLPLTPPCLQGQEVEEFPEAGGGPGMGALAVGMGCPWTHFLYLLSS